MYQLTHIMRIQLDQDGQAFDFQHNSVEKNQVYAK